MTTMTKRERNLAIMRMRAEGGTYREIAVHAGVSPAQVRKIIERITEERERQERERSHEADLAQHFTCWKCGAMNFPH